MAGFFLPASERREICAWAKKQHKVDIPPGIIDRMAREITMLLDQNYEFVIARRKVIEDFCICDDPATGILWRKIFNSILGKLFSNHAQRSKALARWRKLKEKRKPPRSPGPIRITDKKGQLQLI